MTLEQEQRATSGATGVDQELSSARGTSGTQVLQAKLRAPPVPDNFVTRQRLVDLLDELVAAPLTLVVAPAGAGKTALVSGWVATSLLDVTWLTLDEDDRDPHHLWNDLISALEVRSPGCCDRSRALLRRSRPTTEIVTQLLNDLDLDQDEEATHVLVVDDLHLVDDVGDIATSLASFFQHLPTSLHVVVLSRHEPQLPVDRLRVRGQLGEVQFAELRFSPSEAADLLIRAAPSLSPSQMDQAAEAAAGWAAGLQMATLAARSSRARPGADDAPVQQALLLDDFVWRELLVREPPEIVQILREIAVVDRVSTPLAEWLTDRPDAGAVLARAESRGLFVSRTGVDGWFEIHSLVRAALLADLRRRSPTRLTELHERAALWFEQEGEVPTALNHWLLAERPREALHLVASCHADLYDAGMGAVISRMIDAIPPEVSTADVDAVIEFAWCHLLISRQGFAAAVRQAGSWAQQSQLDDRHRSRLTMLEAVVQVVHADWKGSAQLARRGLELCGDQWRLDPITRFGWNLLARDIALDERWDDANDEVRSPEVALSRSLEQRLSFEGTRAMGLALAGHPIEALEAVAGIRQAAAVTNMTTLHNELAVAEAMAHRELGDRERAVSELRIVADSSAETMLYGKLLALLELTEALVSTGDLEPSRRAFDEAATLVMSAAVGSGGRDWLARVGVDMALAGGDVDAARRWAGEQRDPFWRAIDEALVHLSEGDPAAASESLAATEPRCSRHEVVLGLTLARATVDPQDSAKYAVAALETAAAHHMLQTVASVAPDVLDVLEAEVWRVPHAWLGRLRRVLAASGPRTAGRHPELLEPLTPREREVLRFLPSRLTTREIADELYVSVNTLKFHLKVIYRKLGVTSRSEAAEQARRMSSS